MKCIARSADPDSSWPRILMTLRVTGVWDRGYGVPWATAIAVLILAYAAQFVYEARTGTIYSKRP